MRLIDADLLLEEATQEYTRSKQYYQAIKRMIDKAPTIEQKTKVVANLHLNEDKMREIVHEAVENFKEEYEIKQGKWLEADVADIEDTGISEVQMLRCSECGRIHTTPYLYYIDYLNFCPNCGCAMTKE